MPETKSNPGPRLVTPYAFIDTEAFRGAGLDWRSRTWKSLVDLAREGTLRPITTSITRREVQARLDEALAEAAAAARKHAVVFGQLGDGAPLGDGGHDDHRARLHDRFDDLLKKAKFVDVPIEVGIGALLDDYFSGSPPFGEGRKKSEFPDALVLASLVKWLRPHRPRMYVVGKDPDMARFCEGRGDLIRLDSVSELLSLALASSELLSRLDAHVRGDQRLLDAVKRRLDGYRSRHADVDVDAIDFSDLEVDSVLVVDETEDGSEFTLEVGVSAQVEVAVSQVGREYVISNLGEPDMDITTHWARPTASAYVHLEVQVSSHEESGGAAYSTTDWSISSGEVEVRLPGEFTRRAITLAPR